jgi:hypothetical protein
MAGAACSSSSPSPPSLLQPADLADTGAQFDPTEIVDSASFTDWQALAVADVQTFLTKSPYGKGSFLATYASNGASAADAISRTAELYRINPIVFLVRAEMDEGLVGASVYPAPPERVEYAFGCGCAAANDCDPRYAGFDVQVDCLGQALRQDLDDIAANKVTAGGWGPGVTSTTDDGVQVTPQDDSTATLYQYTPVVAVGAAGGNWLFWNIWQAYTGALGYAGPTGTTSKPLAWVGDACTGDATCDFGLSQGTCDMQFPGGMCTASCTTDCPSDMMEAPTFCADFGMSGGFCLLVCNPNSPSCRSGYTCQSAKQYGNAAMTQNVCLP